MASQAWRVWCHLLSLVVLGMRSEPGPCGGAALAHCCVPLREGRQRRWGVHPDYCWPAGVKHAGRPAQRRRPAGGAQQLQYRAAGWAGHLMGLPASHRHSPHCWVCATGLLEPRLRGHCTCTVMLLLGADMGSCTSFRR